MTPTRGALRWLRAAFLAVATVGLAVTAHSLADGHAPGLGALAALTVVTSLVCVLVTGRRRGLAVITGTMGALQVVLHQGFMLLAPVSGGQGCTDRLSTHAQHVAGALHLACGGVAAAHAPHPVDASATMLLAHALATLLLAGALTGGEHALWALLRLVRPFLPTSVGTVPTGGSGDVPGLDVVVPTAWTSVRDLLRRGPPVVLCVVRA